MFNGYILGALGVLGLLFFAFMGYAVYTALNPERLEQVREQMPQRRMGDEQLAQELALQNHFQGELRRTVRGMGNRERANMNSEEWQQQEMERVEKA